MVFTSNTNSMATSTNIELDTNILKCKLNFYSFTKIIISIKYKFFSIKNIFFYVNCTITYKIDIHLMIIILMDGYILYYSVAFPFQKI